jgi:XTP/dITP diphosphohydrolase
MPVVEENMDTYLGNARIKAAAFNHWSKIPSLADDTGLEVAALGGRPGVYSARYAGAQGNAQGNINKLLMELRNIKDRRAVFKCALSLYLNGIERLSVIADLPGEIAEDPSGCGGFGYDSIFYLPDYEMTLAQLKERHIEIETHRVRACKSLFASLAEQSGII